MSDTTLTDRARAPVMARANWIAVVMSAIAPAFFIITTIIGAVRWFSPVPFWDMWDGTLGFNISINRGRWSEFFAQANEHRIVLTKILFLIDYRLFGGLSYFLIAANIVLMAGLVIALAVAARRLTDRSTSSLLIGLSAVLCFSWLQSENINWGYQSGFYMAYLVPLLAMLSLARYIESERAGWFCLAAVLGAVSPVTMANGLSAMPILVAMLLLYGRRLKGHAAIMAIITIAVTALYFTNYAPEKHPIASAVEMVRFILTFLGAPFAYVFQCVPLTFLMGAVCTSAAVFAAVRVALDRNRDPIALALAAFALHACAAAAAAAIGRANLGLGAATSGRYETPVLVLYAVLAILFAHFWRTRAETKGCVAAGLVAFFVILFPFQIQSMSPAAVDIAQRRMQGALALALGVKDNARLGDLYPVDTAARRRSLWARATDAMDSNLTVFALPPLRIAHESIGKPVPVGYEACRGNVDLKNPVTGDGSYEKVDGWAFNMAARRTPEVVLLVDRGIVVGAGVPGASRPDVGKAIDPAASSSGFEGYAKTGSELQIFCKEHT